MNLESAKKSAGFSGYCLKEKTENSFKIIYKKNTILVELKEGKYLKQNLDIK